MQTLEEYTEKQQIKMSLKPISKRPDGINFGANHYRVRLQRGRHWTSVYFSTGAAWTQDPSICDVLDCVISDSQSFEDNDDVYSFAREFGYDDIDEAKEIYRGCRENSRKLRRLLGDEAYDEALYEVEPY
jgi:hypothetical protein